MQKTIKSIFENDMVVETVPWICLGYYLLYHLILLIYSTSEGSLVFVTDILSGISLVAAGIAYKKKNRNNAFSMLSIALTILVLMGLEDIIIKITDRRAFIGIVLSGVTLIFKSMVVYSFIQLSLNVPRNLKMIKINQMAIVLLTILELLLMVFSQATRHYPIFHSIPSEIAILAKYMSIVALEFKLGLYNHK